MHISSKDIEHTAVPPNLAGPAHTRPLATNTARWTRSHLHVHSWVEFRREWCLYAQVVTVFATVVSTEWWSHTQVLTSDSHGGGAGTPDLRVHADG